MAADCRGLHPAASIAATIPDKTSPEPAVASNSLPVRFTYDASFVAMMERGPFSKSVMSSADANSSAAFMRLTMAASEFSPSRCVNSPSCGVSTAFLPVTRSEWPAIANSPSASTTSGRVVCVKNRRTISWVALSLPKPGPNTTAPAWRVTSSSAFTMVATSSLSGQGTMICSIRWLPMAAAADAGQETVT